VFGEQRLPFFVLVNLNRIFGRDVKDKKKIDMKWLEIDWIKAHSRIDFDCEDELLTLYGESAEDTVLNVIARSYTEVIELYGEVPKPLYVASLMLVEVSYTQRAPITQTNLYTVPYAFDMMVKPYMKLASNNNDNNNTQGYGKCKNL
jgi:uncharacterized phage protein (predicted DNA packaging)